MNDRVTSTPNAGEIRGIHLQPCTGQLDMQVITRLLPLHLHQSAAHVVSTVAVILRVLANVLCWSNVVGHQQGVAPWMTAPEYLPEATPLDAVCTEEVGQ